MKNKKFGIVLSVCLIVALAIGGVYASKNMNFFEWGKQAATIKNTSQKDSIATVNGVKIPKSKFDNYKAGLANTNGQFTDEDIIDKLVEQEVIMQEIKKLGYTVTDEEVIAFNNERFDLLEKDPQAYQITKDYVDGLGITMEEYKEMSKEVSKTALLANKYKADIQKEFIDNNTQVKALSAEKKNQKFEEYFENKISDLCDKANIVLSK